MKKLLLVLITGLFLAGCSHTNELGKYNVNGSKMLYKEFVGREAGTIQINIVKNQTKNDKDKKEDGLLDAIAAIGTGILNADKSADIKDWVDTKTIVEEISYGMENILKEYIGVAKAGSIDDNPAFIVETELEKCVLNVSETNVTLQVSANSKIFERGSGNIVWENSEAESIPLKYDPVLGGKKSATESKILTAAQLNSISKKDINSSIDAAVQSVGRKMGETFREDLAESKKKK